MVARHTIAVTGERVASGRIDPEPLGALLSRVKLLANDAVGVRFRGASRVSGRRPEWMRRASDIRLVGMSSGEDGGTRLAFDAPAFGDAAADLYREEALVDGLPDQRDDVFGLISDMLSDVADQDRDSDRFDVSVLERLVRFRHPVFERGVSRIIFEDGGRLGRPPVAIYSTLPDRAASLHRQTPEPVRTRVSGRLGMLRASDSMFSLAVGGAGALRGVLRGIPVASLADLLGREVVVNGWAVFQPSEAVLRVDADDIRLAAPTDRLFAKVPTPPGQANERLTRTAFRIGRTAEDNPRRAHEPWPGNETDDEIRQTLSEIE